MSKRSKKLLLFLITGLIVLLPLSILGISPNEEATAASVSNSPTISEDTVNGRITVETDSIKGIWHYKTLPSESYNQSGGSLYELYYKPTDPGMSQNLISFFRSAGWGNGSSTALHSGVGGVGSTDLYAASTPPATGQTYSFNDLLGDNNNGGTLETHSAATDADGNAVLSFTYRVRNQNTNTEWYRVVKTWTIEPGGAIYLNVDWTVLHSGYFSELGVRANWSYDVGWEKFTKSGRIWGFPDSEQFLININGISTITTAASWDYMNGFHPYWVALTGSSTAPTVRMTADNGGEGFTGSGSYQLGASVWGTPRSPTFEQCTILADSPKIGQHEMNWVAWWSGNPPKGSRYAWLDAGTSWSDSFVIELFSGDPGGGPDISSVVIDPQSRDSAQVSWTTDIESDSIVEVNESTLRPRTWVQVGQDSTLTKNHDVTIDGLSETSSYEYKIKSRDAAGNLTVSSGQIFEMPEVEFNLELYKQEEYWSSYSDYLNNNLSVDFEIKNLGPFEASEVNVVAAQNGSQVTSLSNFPIEAGDISVGLSSVFTIKYNVPHGVQQFTTHIYATGMGPSDDIVYFPRRYQENTLNDGYVIEDFQSYEQG